jgi:hypothetical protein
MRQPRTIAALTVALIISFGGCTSGDGKSPDARTT